MTTQSNTEAALEEAYRINAEYQRLKQLHRNIQKEITRIAAKPDIPLVDNLLREYLVSFYDGCAILLNKDL